MNDGSGNDVRWVCDEWGPVLERLFAEHDITPLRKAGAPSEREVLAAADDVADALQTIRAEQRERDSLAAEEPGAGGIDQLRTTTRLEDRVSELVTDPDAVQKLDLALVRIRAWSAQD